MKVWFAYLMNQLVQVTFFKTYFIMRTGTLLNIIFFCSTLKKNWKVRVIKIPYNDLPNDFNNLKLIWINTKKEERFFIKKNSLVSTRKKGFLYQSIKIRMGLIWRNMYIISHQRYEVRKTEWKQLKLMILWELLL